MTVMANRQERTEWHSVSVWGKQAEICGQYLAKGRKVYLEGRLQELSTPIEGVNRRAWDVVANNVVFLSGRDDSGGGGWSGGQKQGGGQGGGWGGGQKQGGGQGGGWGGGQNQGGGQGGGWGGGQNQGGGQGGGWGGGQSQGGGQGGSWGGGHPHRLHHLPVLRVVMAQMAMTQFHSRALLNGSLAVERCQGQLTGPCVGLPSSERASPHLIAGEALLTYQ